MSRAKFQQRYVARAGSAPYRCCMPANPPLVASGAREPDKQRPRPIPRAIRDMIALMVYGQVDDPDCRALDFIEAARQCGIKPDIARKWLDRSEVRKLLLAERRVFRDAVCAGNEGALKRVRDKSENGMAVIGAVRTLENLAEETVHGARGSVTTPGLVIQIVQAPAPREPFTIDVKPETVPMPADASSAPVE
jgi:hypothetical protein